MSISKGIALITGSAQGIGRSIALRLAKDGFDIALNDVPSKYDKLRSVADDAEKVGRRTLLYPADVTVETEVKGMIQDVSKQLGGLDVLVANAGVFGITSLVTTELDELERIMSVNVCGAFLCYKYAAQEMIRQGRGGRIIGASSAAGKVGACLTAPYSASKFAIRGLTQAAAMELGQHKITVNCYAPGVIDTSMIADLGGMLARAEPELAKLFGNIPSTRPMDYNGQPEDVADLVSFLASKEARYITGQSISVDGGLTVS